MICQLKSLWILWIGIYLDDIPTTTDMPKMSQTNEVPCTSSHPWVDFSWIPWFRDFDHPVETHVSQMKCQQADSNLESRSTAVGAPVLAGEGFLVNAYWYVVMLFWLNAYWLINQWLLSGYCMWLAAILIKLSTSGHQVVKNRLVVMLFWSAIIAG